MFCPKCGAEFVDGIKVCSDCGVPLVKERPVEEKPQCRKLVEVFSSVFLSESAIVKAMLEGSGISCWLYNTHYPAIASTGVAVPIRVMVEEKDIDFAREILNDYLNKRK